MRGLQLPQRRRRSGGGGRGDCGRTATCTPRLHSSLPAGEAAAAIGSKVFVVRVRTALHHAPPIRQLCAWRRVKRALASRSVHRALCSALETVCTSGHARVVCRLWVEQLGTSASSWSLGADRESAGNRVGVITKGSDSALCPLCITTHARLLTVRCRVTCHARTPIPRRGSGL